MQPILNLRIEPLILMFPIHLTVHMYINQTDYNNNTRPTVLHCQAPLSTKL